MEFTEEEKKWLNLAKDNKKKYRVMIDVSGESVWIDEYIKYEGGWNTQFKFNNGDQIFAVQLLSYLGYNVDFV